MLDFSVMFWVKLLDKKTVPVNCIIHTQSNKFATVVENKARGDSKLNDSREIRCVDHFKMFFLLWQPVFTMGT